MADNYDEKTTARDASPAFAESPDHQQISIKEYCLTRFSSLKPPMNKVENPFKLLAMLNARQWSFFTIGFLSWSWDAFDCRLISYFNVFHCCAI